MLLSGLLFTLLGLVVILTSPLPGWPKSLASLSWLGCLVFGIFGLLSRYRRIVGYRLYADGSVEFTYRDGSRGTGQLASGTVLLPGLAWLRVRASHAAAWGELVAGDSRTSKQWRRFQVICRHVGPC